MKKIEVKIPEIDQAIADLQAICNSTGDDCVTEIANHAAAILGMLQRGLPATLNKRKCWQCKTVSYHADNRTPYVLCPKCRSCDTRLVLDPASVPCSVSVPERPG